MKTFLILIALILPAFAQADIHCVAHIGHFTLYSCEGENLVPVTYPVGIPSNGGSVQLANTHRMSYIISEFKRLNYKLVSCEIINEKAEAICIFLKPS